MRRCLFSISLLTITVYPFAQNGAIDSLQGKLRGATDTSKVTILLEVGNIYATSGKYDSALSSYFNALNTAEHITDKTHSLRSLREIADLYALQNKVEMALKFAFKALKIAEEQKKSTWYL